MGSVGPAFRNIYSIVGGILSLFYIAIGFLFIDGKITFNFEPMYQKIFGGVLVMYGLFRVNMFYRRFKQMRNEEE